jgi:hypothetical protein
MPIVLQAAALSSQLGVPVQASWGFLVEGEETDDEKQKIGDQLAQIASLTASVQKEVRQRWETRFSACLSRVCSLESRVGLVACSKSLERLLA